MKKKLLYITRFFDPSVSSGLTNRFLKSLNLLCEKYEVHICLFFSKDYEEQIFKDFFKNKVKDILLCKIDDFKKYIKYCETLLFKRNFYNIYNNKKIKEAIKNYAEKNNIDILYANYFYSALIFRDTIFKNKMKIVDLVDAVSLHMAEAKDSGFIRDLFYKRIERQVLEMELQTIKSSDIIFITTQREKEYFYDKLDKKYLKRMYTLWNGVDNELFQVGEKKLELIEKNLFKVNNKIAFLGSLDYYPNDMAALRLVNKIFPSLLKRKPDLELYIIGKSPSKKLKQTCSKSRNIKLLGYVQDLKSFLLNIDMLVLPMTIASGIQNKLLTGLASAVPVVISSRALFSEELKQFYNIVVADSDEEYVENILKLYNDITILLEISKNSYDFADKHLRWNKILIDYYKILLK